MSFLNFVAIRLNQASKQAIDYKSISSFLSSIKGNEDMDVPDLLKLWICNMIEGGIAVASRKRYVEKLSSLYREYSSNTASNALEGIKELSTIDAPACAKQFQTELSRIECIFDSIMADAKSKPEMAVFLYMLFNASADIGKAISLTADDYTAEFRQLDEIINISRLHHRRKYLFELNQSRKRMPQLVREMTGAIDVYFKINGINFPGGFTNKTISSLWMAKARRCGVTLTDLTGMVDVLPTEYEYLGVLKSRKLNPEERRAIKHRVAESFAPSGKRWYAMKLRRGVTYETFNDYIKSGLAELYSDNLLFYPQKKHRHRIDRKIVTTVTPIIPDVVFILINPRHIRNVDSHIKLERMGYVFRNTSAADSEYSVIATQSMTVFQHMIGIFTPDIKVELTEELPVGLGREVLITGGIMAGFEGTIYDIKEGSDIRQIYIRLSDKYSIKAEVMVEEYFVKTII